MRYNTCISRLVTKPFSSLSHTAKRFWARTRSSLFSSAIFPRNSSRCQIDTGEGTLNIHSVTRNYKRLTRYPHISFNSTKQAKEGRLLKYISKGTTQRYSCHTCDWSYLLSSCETVSKLFDAVAHKKGNHMRLALVAMPVVAWLY